MKIQRKRKFSLLNREWVSGTHRVAQHQGSWALPSLWGPVHLFSLPAPGQVPNRACRHPRHSAWRDRGTHGELQSSASGGRRRGSSVGDVSHFRATWPTFRQFVQFFKKLFISWVLPKQHTHDSIKIIIQGYAQVGSAIRPKAGGRTKLSLRAHVSKVASQ